MCYALDKEQTVCGFVNTHPDGLVFDLDDIRLYEMSLWNAGVGPIRLNYTTSEMAQYLDDCIGICLADEIFIERKWKIQKNLIPADATKEEIDFLGDNEDTIRKFHLMCLLRVSMNTPTYLFWAMGLTFIHDD